MTCSTQVGDTSIGSYALGLQQAFKRQGIFYFNADVGASIFVLSAKADEEREEVEGYINQPLQNVRVHLYGLNLRGYIEFGVTPARYFPDLLVSFGVGHHLSTGNIKVDDKRERMNISTNMGYAQLELVWWRFGDGSLSSYLSTESGGSHRLKGDYGAYRNLKVEPSIQAFGLLKVVMPFNTR